MNEREVLASFEVSTRLYKSGSSSSQGHIEKLHLFDTDIFTMKYALVFLVSALGMVAAIDVISTTPLIPILRQSNYGPNPDGSYSFSYETGNGISAEESGVLKKIGEESGMAVEGKYAYTADDGTPISVSYVADENGFQPQGAHLPVAHPIPEHIIRALEWIATHPEEDKLVKK